MFKASQEDPWAHRQSHYTAQQTEKVGAWPWKFWIRWRSSESFPRNQVTSSHTPKMWDSWRILGLWSQSEPNLMVTPWRIDLFFYPHITHLILLEPQRQFFTFLMGANSMFPEQWDHRADWVPTWISLSNNCADFSHFDYDIGQGTADCSSRVSCCYLITLEFHSVF